MAHITLADDIVPICSSSYFIDLPKGMPRAGKSSVPSQAFDSRIAECSPSTTCHRTPLVVGAAVAGRVQSWTTCIKPRQNTKRFAPRSGGDHLACRNNSLEPRRSPLMKSRNGLQQASPHVVPANQCREALLGFRPASVVRCVHSPPLPASRKAPRLRGITMYTTSQRWSKAHHTWTHSSCAELLVIASLLSLLAVLDIVATRACRDAQKPTNRLWPAHQLCLVEGPKHLAHRRS